MTSNQSKFKFCREKNDSYINTNTNEKRTSLINTLI